MASRLPLIISCALFSSAAGAAELGDARVSSWLGQQLVADIELNTLDAPATPVQVRLAHPNVYRGANIGMPPVLSTLTMTVMQRDGRQFLHVTSTAPVESSHLHLYLELLDGGQRNVRLATLSMARNPNPPPPPPPPPAPVKPPEPVVAAAPVAAPVAPRPAPPRPRPAPAPKPVVIARAEPPPVVKEAPKLEPKKEVRPAPKPEPVAPPLPLATDAAPAACAPSGIDRSTVCAALDYKNAQLREQIDTLEGKVRVLQVALGASPSGISKPKPPDPNKPHPARKRPEPEPEAPTPWGMIGAAIGGLLALAGAAILLLRRRKRAGQIQPMPRVPMMTRLRQRFARKKAAQEAVEPQLDESEA